LLIDIVDITGNQKSNFKNLKQEKQNCYAPKKYSPIAREYRVGLGDLIWKCPAYQNFLLSTSDNEVPSQPALSKHHYFFHCFNQQEG
jgi:hypothetical protein